MLWDRAEGSGYVRHIVADPLPGTPAKTVLMHVAFGDWQVSELTAMIAARTMGVPIHRPVTADGRSREVEPGWGLDTLEYPSRRIGPGDLGFGLRPDPDRADRRRAPAAIRTATHATTPTSGQQKAAFLFDGELIDVCAAAACTATPGD